jgi:hypothetical protein
MKSFGFLVSAGESPNEIFVDQMYFFLQNDNRMKKIFLFRK